MNTWWKHSFLLIFAASLAVSAGNARAESRCGYSTRQTVDFLKCNEATSSDLWYRISINFLCGQRAGKKETIVEVEQRSAPKVHKFHAQYWQGTVKALIEKNGKKPWTVFREELGGGAFIETTATPSQDFETIEVFRIRIKPKKGTECRQDIRVPVGVWLQDWGR